MSLFVRRARFGAVRPFDLARRLSVPNPLHGAARCLSQSAPMQQTLPEHHISQFPLSDASQRSLTENFGITTLFPIQALVFSAVHAGKDMIGKSRTGTGKTLAFVLPLAERLASERYRPKSQQAAVLIMEPTRELAKQVAAEIEKFDSSLRIATLYGGSAFGPQVGQLAKGVHFIIATPGRLLDHLTRGTVDLSALQTVVLDESDEMLRMGFQGDVDSILESVKRKTQMLLFSATVPSWIKDLSRKYCDNPEVVDVVGDQKTMTPSTLTHKCVVSSGDDKAELIGALIRQNTTPTGRVIVFTKTKMEAERLSKSRELGVATTVIHGDVSQNGRDSALLAFRAGNPRVMVATDLAARGLDIPNVELVIHCEFPDEVERFVHRSGRSGRAGKQGVSVVIYQPSERGMIRDLSQKIGVPIHAIRLKAEEISEAGVAAEVRGILQNARVRSSTPSFVEMAKKLTAAHPEILASLLAHQFGISSRVRSELSGLAGYTTINLTGRDLSTHSVVALLNKILGRDVANRISQVETFSQRREAVIELDAGVAQELKLLAAAQPDNEELQNFAFDEPLPAGVFEGAISSGVIVSDSQGRGRKSSSSSSGSVRGGSSGSYGGGGGGFGSSNRYGSSDRFSSYGRDSFGSSGRDNYGSGRGSYGGGFGGRDSGRGGYGSSSYGSLGSSSRDNQSRRPEYSRTRDEAGSADTSAKRPARSFDDFFKD